MQVLNRGMGGSPQELVKGATGIAAAEEESWPYWWLFPRKGTQFKQSVGSIAAPNPGVLTEVCEVVVPSGFVFVLRAIRQNFATAANPSPFVDGSGDILFTVDVDVPIGAIALSGYPLPDLSGMADERGSKLAPWPLEGYTVFTPYQVVRYKVITTNVIPVGSPHFITCGLFGWLAELY